jgi:DNA-binding CsgD family transcriptional regulator
MPTHLTTERPAAPIRPPADLYAAVSDFANRLDDLRTPEAVLDAVQDVSTTSLPLNVLGAGRFPLVGNHWRLELGKSAFLHSSAPPGWWEEYSALETKNNFRPALFLAQSSLASYTWTEMRRLIQPIGVDRWGQELALKYGMRDGLTCPVGGRWVVVFWSPKELTNLLTQPIRIVVYAAASFAVLRLEQLVAPDIDRLPTWLRMTERELAVLRLVSMGGRSSDIAQALGLGEETIRSHLKKAQTKLDARNRTHAACEALRRQLIP